MIGSATDVPASSQVVHGQDQPGSKAPGWEGADSRVRSLGPQRRSFKLKKGAHTPETGPGTKAKGVRTWIPEAGLANRSIRSSMGLPGRNPGACPVKPWRMPCEATAHALLSIRVPSWLSSFCRRSTPRPTALNATTTEGAMLCQYCLLHSRRARGDQGTDGGGRGGAR